MSNTGNELGKIYRRNFKISVFAIDVNSRVGVWHSRSAKRVIPVEPLIEYQKPEENRGVIGTTNR